MEDGRASGKEEGWIGESVRITSPTIILANQVAVPVEVSFTSKGGPSHSSDLYEFWTEVQVPLKIPRQVGLPAILSKVGDGEDDDDDDFMMTDLQNIEEVIGTTTATILIGKLKIHPVLEMKVSGLKNLGDIYEGSSSKFRAMVNAKFGTFNFHLKLGVMDITGGGGEGEILLGENFLRHFGSLPIHENDTGIFSVSVFWEHFPLAHASSYRSKLAEAILSQEIQDLEGSVALVARNGKTIKYPKALLAACSSKYFGQFRSGMKEASGGKVDLPLYCTPDEVIGEEGLAAFVQFIAGLSVKSPMATPSIALELLMAGQYNLIPELELTMRNILLFQPSSWFDVATSIRLCCYANRIYKMLGEADEAKPKWKALMLKGIWNLKGKSKKEIQECPEADNMFNNKEMSIHVFTLLISLV